MLSEENLKVAVGIDLGNLVTTNGDTMFVDWSVIERLMNAVRAEERARALEVVKPFAVVGRIIDGPFGPPGAADEGVFQSGAAWSVDGEKRTLTWGDFRRAAAYVTDNQGEA